MKTTLVFATFLFVALAFPQPPAGPGGAGGRGGSGRGGRGGSGRGPVARTFVTAPDLGFEFDENPLPLPSNVQFASSIAGIAINSKGHIFVYQRADAGKPMLLEFDQNQKFVKAWGDGIAVRPHGMRIDAQDNIWITDVSGNTVMKLNPSGEVVMTLGTKGKTGAWNEATGEHYLNQPTDLAFGENGEIFVSLGHGSQDPRVLRFDRNGKLITQWSGKVDGPGAFSMIHTIARDVRGNIYLADREVKHLVVYDSDGKWKKTIQMQSLLCGFYVTKNDEFYMTAGQEGQIEKLDWNGNVLAVTGKGPGSGHGQFGEAHYMAMDSKGDIYICDTVNGRVVKLYKRS
jgi:DNA-binding beta-propeller fold protein YncE